MQMRVESLEATVERLQSEKTELASEKAALQGQVAMLTHVLHMRDTQLAQTRQDSAAGVAPSRPAVAQGAAHVHLGFASSKRAYATYDSTILHV